MTNILKQIEELHFHSQLFNGIPDPIVATDAYFNIVSYNKYAEEVFLWKTDEVIGKPVRTVVQSVYPGTTPEDVTETLLKKGSWKGEILTHRKNGEQFPAFISVSIISNEAGDVTGTIAVIRDLSNQKKQEAEIRLLASNLEVMNQLLHKNVAEKTEELTGVFENITDGVVAFDQDWNYTYVNKKGAEAINSTPEELIGKNPWKLFPEMIGSPLYKSYRTAAREQRVVKSTEYVAQFAKWFEGVIYPSSRGVVAYFQDVTDRKNAEIALKNSEELYRTIVETAQEGVLQIDENNIITFANTYLASLLNCTIKDLVGKNVLNIVGDHNVDFVLEHIKQKKQGVTQQYEMKIFDSAGKPIDTLIQSCPLFRNDAYVGSISTILNITNWKQGEVRLQQSERLFKSLFQYSNDGIALLSANAVILDVSPSIEGILGLNKEELVNTRRLDFVSPEDVTLIHSAFRKVMQDPTSTETVEYKAILPDKSRKWIECTFSNLLDEPEVNAVVLNFRDITHRKRSEEQLLESEKKYRQIVETAQEGIWMFDEELRTTFVNQKICDLLEYTQEEMIGKKNSDFRKNYNLEDIQERIERRKQGLSETHESEFVSKSGKVIYTLVSTNPIFDEAGNLKGTLAMVTDITPIKKAEQDKETSRKNNEALINSTDDMIWSVSKDYHLVATNNRFIDSIKLAANIRFKIGDNLLSDEAYPLEHLTFWKGLYDRALAGESFKVELVNFSVDEKHKKWLELSFNPIFEEEEITGVACYSRDITEKKIAATRLKESETYLAEAQRLSKMGSWTFDLLTDQLTWSEQLYNVLGTTKEQFNETHPSFLDLIVADDKERVAQVSLQCRLTGEPFSIEYSITTVAGDRRIIQEHGSAEKDENGNVIRLFGTAQDVTEKRKVEDQIRITKGQLDIIYNTVSDIIFMLNIEDNEHYKFISANQTFLTATGLIESQVINKDIREVIPPSSHNLVLSHYKKAVENRKTVSWDEESEYPTGKKIATVTISPVLDEDGLPILLVGSIHDITEQKLSEQLLIQSEEKYRLLFERSPMPMWIFDTETLDFLEVNPAAIDHYGYSREEFLKMNLNDIRPKDSNLVLTELENNSYRNLHAANSYHIKKNGNLMKVQVSVSAIEYENKKARLVLLIDRTEQERAKDELIATTLELRDLASHLQNIREDERIRMAREIHDELGQQLTGIKMDIAWIDRRLNKEDVVIRQKVKSSLQLVDSTITTVRKIASELRPGILDDLGLSEAIDWHSREFTNRTSIAVKFTSGVPDIKFTQEVSTALFRIFQEALTNVARHSNATEVHCTLQQKNSCLYLTISDNGKGFTTEGQAGRKTLGILGMKERVAILNGKYTITSAPGRGTKVKIEIPL